MISQKKIQSKLIAATILTIFLLEGGLAVAQSYDPSQDIPQPTMLQKRVDKFGRGFTNILFGWTEIPVTWDKKMKQGKPLTYLFGTAPIVGTVRAFMRTGVGVYEMFTFFTSSSEVNYETLIEPEYVF